MRGQALIYRDRLNALLENTQSGVKYLYGFLLCVAEDGHFLHLEDGDSDEEHGSRAPPSAGSDRGDTVVVLSLSSILL